MSLDPTAFPSAMQIAAVRSIEDTHSAFDSTLVLSEKPMGPDCAEWPDNDGHAHNIVVPDGASFGSKPFDGRRRSQAAA